MKLIKVISEIGYYDKILQEKSGSESIAEESIENSSKERGKTDQESHTTEADQLPSRPGVKSEGKKTFEKNITSD